MTPARDEADVIDARTPAVFFSAIDLRTSSMLDATSSLRRISMSSEDEISVTRFPSSRSPAISIGSIEGCPGPPTPTAWTSTGTAGKSATSRSSSSRPSRSSSRWPSSSVLPTTWPPSSKTRRIGPLVDQYPEPLCEIHPRLAEVHGIADGDLVRVTSRRGTMTLPAKVVGTIRPDTDTYTYSNTYTYSDTGAGA